MTVGRGPEAYTYENLQVELYSPCDHEQIADTATFSVYFNPPCSDVTIFDPKDNWIINQSNNDTLQVTIKDYDLTNENLIRIECQYSKLDEDDWIRFSYIDIENLPQNYFTCTWDVSSLDDGAYEIRAVSVCSAGENYSEVLSGIIDRTSPELIGKQPADGILSPGDEISFTFNEFVDGNSVTMQCCSLVYDTDGTPINIQLSYYENKIFITPDIDNYYIENQTLKSIASCITDKNGNELAEPISWPFYVDLGPLHWNPVSISGTSPITKKDTLESQLENSFQQTVQFTISDLPWWITPEPTNGTLQNLGCGSIDFIVSDLLDMGVYEDTIFANVQSWPAEPIYLTVYRIPGVTHFQPIYSGNPYLAMNLYITEATLDDETIVAGDEVGIFDGDYCVGAGIVLEAIDPYLALVASTDDPGTSEIDGFTAGHSISYRFWDVSAQEEIDKVQAVYSDGSGLFASQGSAVLTLFAVTSMEQDIALSSGWNIISFYVEPEEINLKSIVQPLIDNGSLLKIQDETGAAIEELPVIGWVDNIGNMSVCEGYYIKVSSDQDLSIEGNSVSLPIEILLNTGWNIMGYPVTAAQDAMSALQPLIDADDLLKVQDETGAAIEELLIIGWVNNIGNFQPDEGYYIKVASSTSITLDKPTESPSQKIATEESSIKPTHFVSFYESNPYLAMNIYILDATLDEKPLKECSEIGVFDGELCVGSSVITKSLTPDNSYLSIAVTTDDPMTEEMDGFIPANKVFFRLWDGKEEYTMSATVYSEENQNTLNFESLGTIVVNLAGNTIPKEYQLYACYPNPFNPSTIIKYNLPEPGYVKLAIYDLRGRLVRTLVSEFKEAGYQSVIWDGMEDNGRILPSGVYLYRLTAGNFSELKKMVLVK